MGLSSIQLANHVKPGGWDHDWGWCNLGVTENELAGRRTHRLGPNRGWLSHMSVGAVGPAALRFGGCCKGNYSESMISAKTIGCTEDRVQSRMDSIVCQSLNKKGAFTSDDQYGRHCWSIVIYYHTRSNVCNVCTIPVCTVCVI